MGENEVPKNAGFTNGIPNEHLTSNLPPLYNHCIDDYRPIKVICIGAGLSGILAGIRFPQRIKNLDFTIYDKNEDVGGTWFENRYPGVRCDVPSHCYQYTFESNTQWSEYYCEGAEIQRYFQRVARKFGIFEDTCDVFVTAVGILNKWQWPTIEGFNECEVPKVHSANWDPNLDLKGKNIAVIGAGSSGIQIVPTLQPIVKRLDHYMSGKTWISPIGFGSDELKNRGAIGNFKHTPEELAHWKKHPEDYLKYRHRIEKLVNGAALITVFGTPTQTEFKLINQEAMRKRLEKKPEIMDALEPKWPPGCRRLTPGPGYLEALCEDNVDFINTKIKRFTKEGIETVDGKERKVDVIVCATGFDTTLKQPMPILGENGISLNEVWDPVPECYFGILPPKMPNMFRFLGPNGAPGTGGLVHLVECACEYMIMAIKKLQREYIKSIVVKPERMTMLSKHIDGYFSKTIYTQPCKSWIKRGKEDGRVVTIWPGSCIHAVVAFENPRWEDFDYTYLPETEDNYMTWLGKGLTLAQEADEQTTDYLDTVDKPPVINPEEDLDDIKVPGLL